MSNVDDALLRDLMNTFRAEAAEHIQVMNQSLLQIERQAEDAQKQSLLQEAFRAAHSLKGAARAVSLNDVERLAHALENILQQARDDGLDLDANTCDTLYSAVDGIENLLNGDNVDVDSLVGRIDATTAPVPADEPPGETEKTAEPAAPVQNGVVDETIRVSVGKLDDLMAEVGELLVTKISADQRQADISALGQQLNHWSKTWREIKALLPRLDSEAGQQLGAALVRHADQMQAVIGSYGDLHQSMGRDAVRLGMLTSGLQDKVRRVRMVPFQNIALTLERAVRDAARSEGKNVVFKLSGDDVELDKKVLESLKDPLLHLLRNAVSHGIEGEAERAAAGKPAEGRVWLHIRQRGSEVRLLVRDDGRGFNLDALRAAYQRRTGMALDDTASTDEVINLAFQPGVSTAAQVSTIAGRGVGLDVVRQRLEAVQGRIQITNQAGQGAAIELIVPTTLAITRALLVRSGAEMYALPMLAIEKIVTVEDRFMIGGRSMLKVDDNPMPLVALHAILQRTADERYEGNPLAVVMGVAEQRIAILVDDVLTEQELAVKSLAHPLQRVRNIGGAALMGNGQPVVVLNPADLMRSARGASSVVINRQTVEEKQIPTERILIVDDSITTRTLEKNILETAGYIVVTATHGLEALEMLKEHAISLVVSDVQMPHMDGIELTHHLREHAEYDGLPVILVTSLESREDRERGMLAGADAYIVKRGFDQAELLSTIRRLL